MATWKEGHPTGIVEPTSPRVQVVDTHRKPGQKLVGFEILSDSADSRVRTFSVRLTLIEPEERPVVRFLVVGIDPILVFRQEDYELLMHWEHQMDPEPEKGATAPAPRVEVRAEHADREAESVAVAGPGSSGPCRSACGSSPPWRGVPDRRPMGRAPDLLGPLDSRRRPATPRWARSRPTPSISARWTPASSPTGRASARSATWPWSATKGDMGPLPERRRRPGAALARSDPARRHPDRAGPLSATREGDPHGRASSRSTAESGDDPGRGRRRRGLLARARAIGRGRPRPARRLDPGPGKVRAVEASADGRARLVVEVLDPPPSIRSARFASIAVRSPDRRSRAVPLDAPGRAADPSRRAPIVPRLPRPSRGHPGRAGPLPEGRETARAPGPGRATSGSAGGARCTRRSSPIAPASECEECGGMTLVPRVVSYRPTGRGPRRPRVGRDRHRHRGRSSTSSGCPGCSTASRSRLGPRCGDVLSGRRGAGGRPGGGRRRGVPGRRRDPAEPEPRRRLLRGQAPEVAASKPDAPAETSELGGLVADRPRLAVAAGDLPGHGQAARLDGDAGPGRRQGPDGLPLLRGVRRGHRRRPRTSISPSSRRGPDRRTTHDRPDHRLLDPSTEGSSSSRAWPWPCSGSLAIRDDAGGRDPRPLRGPGDRLRRLAGPRPARGRGPGHLSRSPWISRGSAGCRSVRSSSDFHFSMIHVILDESVDRGRRAPPGPRAAGASRARTSRRA